MQQALMQCIANISACPGSGWEAVAKPLTTFAVALLEKGNVKAAELADLFDSMITAASAYNASLLPWPVTLSLHKLARTLACCHGMQP